MSLEAAAVSVPPLGLVKMEDRKRASTSDHHDDSAPPAKRQATNANGPAAESAADGVRFGTHGSPWQTELEVSPSWRELQIAVLTGKLQTFQKDALLRQLREFKREKLQMELQLLELQKYNKWQVESIMRVDSALDLVRNLPSPLLSSVSVLISTSVPRQSPDPSRRPAGRRFSSRTALNSEHPLLRAQEVRGVLVGAL
jgi:E3 ubiquitin-protein ligase BRE1